MRPLLRPACRRYARAAARTCLRGRFRWLRDPAALDSASPPGSWAEDPPLRWLRGSRHRRRCHRFALKRSRRDHRRLRRPRWCVTWGCFIPLRRCHVSRGELCCSSRAARRGRERRIVAERVGNRFRVRSGSLATGGGHATPARPCHGASGLVRPTTRWPCRVGGPGELLCQCAGLGVGRLRGVTMCNLHVTRPDVTLP